MGEDAHRKIVRNVKPHTTSFHPVLQSSIECGDFNNPSGGVREYPQGYLLGLKMNVNTEMDLLPFLSGACSTLLLKSVIKPPFALLFNTFLNIGYAFLMKSQHQRLANL